MVSNLFCILETTAIESTTTLIISEPCDVSKPNQIHPTDCHLFYQCVPGFSEAKLVEKSCGSSMLYNPDLQVCDWPSNVLLKRPECADNTIAEKITKKPVGVGTVFLKYKRINLMASDF